MKPAAAKAIKPMNPRTPEIKYTGLEPDWSAQPQPEQRASALMRAFTWYNYHYGKKDVKDIVIDWLTRHERTSEARSFARVPEVTLPNQLGWLCRMNLRGLEWIEREQSFVEDSIANHLAAVKAVKQIDAVTEDAAPRITIQDRLRDKAYEIAGEIDGMYDDMIAAGAKMNADYKPMAVMRGMNISPQMISVVTEHWQRRLAELDTVQKGKDAQLVEGYSNFSKLQIKNLIKFCEQVLADCASYVQIKKTERSPRKKKPVSAEKLTQRFRYLREFDELKLRSESVTKLVGASEAWLYDTKKRKLIYVVADAHVGTMTVKGTSLLGFDTTNSVQKTLRKPAEQIKALMTGGVPAARKFFKEIRATEIRYNGRSNENLILLRIR
jgi:hypothetical protein